ncbi:MAG: guanylate kinase [Anaerolineae bacterium]
MSDNAAPTAEAPQPVANLSVEQGQYTWSPNPLILVVSGPSAAGKDVLIAELRRRYDSLHFVVTATSREARPGERHGVDYYFLSRQEFEERLERGEFLENAVIYDDRYGVLSSELTDALNGGRDVVMRVDVQGARTLRRLLPDAVFVFVLAESEQEHLRRLRDRGSEDNRSLEKRMARVRQEIAALPEFDYVIVNRCGHLEDAVCTLCAIFDAEKARVHQRRQRVGRQ